MRSTLTQPSLWLCLWLVCFGIGPWSSSAAELSPEDDETFFETRIRPLLAGSCVECHGPNKSSGGLRLDSHAALLKGGDSGAVIESGQPEASLLLRAVRHEPDSQLKMPPDQPLAPQQIADLTQWIQAGAKWPKSLTTPIVSNRKHWRSSHCRLRGYQMIHRTGQPNRSTALLRRRAALKGSRRLVLLISRR